MAKDGLYKLGPSLANNLHGRSWVNQSRPKLGSSWNDRDFKSTKASVTTIERIIKEVKESSAKNNGTIILRSPDKKRKKNPVTDVAEYVFNIIRHIIYNFHKTERNRACVKSLRQKLMEDLGWSGSEKSLRIILKKLNFKWRKNIGQQKNFNREK
ncbi:hypothetical protein RN001_007572 [Aquatica leii]|uniref:Uncharacterized protein n=1 Tax=Aquatica leii TaxID=1421715 RepID=A0AAN7PDB2_9COLE|nr:hypothetical protein RN001_007572 [Aquatica leii]